MVTVRYDSLTLLNGSSVLAKGEIQTCSLSNSFKADFAAGLANRCQNVSLKQRGGH